MAEALSDQYKRIRKLIHIGIGGILVGLYMRTIHPGIVSKTALTYFITQYMHPLLGGVVLGTLFIAVVGTGAGLVLGIAIILKRDVLSHAVRGFKENIFRKITEKITEKKLIVLILLLACILSIGPLGDTILNFAFMSMGLRGATLFASLCFAIFCPGRVSAKCAMISIITGPAIVLLFNLLDVLPFEALFAGILVSGFIMFIGLVKNRFAEKKLKKQGCFAVVIQLLQDEILLNENTKEMRILSIGNSFAADTMEHLAGIASSIGVKCFKFTYLYIGGCSINRHFNNALNNSADYQYFVNNGLGWEETGKISIDDAVKEEKWDYISIQHGTGDKSRYTSPESYENLLPLIRYVKKIAHKDVKIGSLIPLLKKQRKLTKDNNELDLVFPSKAGGYIDPGNYNRKFYKIVKRAGLPKANPHSLRHSFATRALEAGVDLKTTQELLGHSSVEITANLYTHALMKHKRNEVKKLETVFLLE